MFRSSNVIMLKMAFQSNSVLKRKPSSRAWYGRYNPEYLTRQADLFTSQSWMFVIQMIRKEPHVHIFQN